MNLAYGLFMAEAENRFPKERARAIQEVINDLIIDYTLELNLNDVVDNELAAHNLLNVSNKECDYIKNEVLKNI